NIYQMNLNDRTTVPLTDLQTGVEQMSISLDGSRMVVNSINKGQLDIFMIRSPLSRKKDQALKTNYWAQRRAQETEAERVPAVGYVQQMLRTTPADSTSLSEAAVKNIKDRPSK